VNREKENGGWMTDDIGTVWRLDRIQGRKSRRYEVPVGGGEIKKNQRLKCKKEKKE
jgi:hypothetical protein